MPAYEIPNLRFSGEAETDIARRRFLKVTADEKVTQTVAGEAVIGASSIDCKAGQVMEIYDGIVIVEAGAAVVAGAAVMSDANGKAITLDTGVATNVKAGTAMTNAGADAELLAVKVY